VVAAGSAGALLGAPEGPAGAPLTETSAVDMRNETEGLLAWGRGRHEMCTYARQPWPAYFALRPPPCLRPPGSARHSLLTRPSSSPVPGLHPEQAGATHCGAEGLAAGPARQSKPTHAAGPAR
jgi:hypothetical protein